MRARRLLVWIPLLAALGCTSPESRRVRGGDRGADAGNRDRVVEMHGGSDPYYRTPCRAHEPCTGPLPTFGLPEYDRKSND